MNQMMAQRPGRLWHGGFPDLKPGDLLLPPSATGQHRQAAMVNEMISAHPGFDPDDVRPDDRSPHWVHFTPHRNVALAYAASARTDYGRGALYVVEPIGPVEVDPDMPVQGLRAHTARIVTVYDPCVNISDSRSASLHAATIAVERGTSRRVQRECLDRYVRTAVSSSTPVQVFTAGPGPAIGKRTTLP